MAACRLEKGRWRSILSSNRDEKRLCRKIWRKIRSSLCDSLLGSQGIELFRWGLVLAAVLLELALANHMHHLDPRQCALSGPERLEAQHRPGEPLDRAMILFHDIIQILGLTDLNGCLLLGVVALDRRLIGAALIDRDLRRCPLIPDRLAQKAQGGRTIPVGCEQKIYCLARFVVNLSDEVALAARLQNRA